jgi:hypothetical protein
VLKPDQGGSGLASRCRFASQQVEEIFRRILSCLASRQPVPASQRIPAATIPEQGMCASKLGGELLYAMRSRHGRFNLCPSPACNPEDGEGIASPRTEQTHHP